MLDYICNKDNKGEIFYEVSSVNRKEVTENSWGSNQKGWL